MPAEIRIGRASARLGSLKQEYHRCSSGFIRSGWRTGRFGTVAKQSLRNLLLLTVWRTE